MSNALRLLFLVSLSVLWPTQTLSAQEGQVVETFGTPGDVGSFRVGFTRVGADIQWVQALDHYVTIKERDRDRHEDGDYLLLIDSSRHAMTLGLLGGGNTAFAKDPATAQWEVQQNSDEVVFTLADDNGLVLEKKYVHDQAARGFHVEITLRNQSSQFVGNLQLSMTGPALVNPQQTGWFGDTAYAIAASIGDGVAVNVKPSPKGELQALEVNAAALSFAGSANRFFGGFVWPQDDLSRNVLTSLTAETVPPRVGVEPPDNPTTRVLFGMQVPVPKQGEATTLRYGLYLGPKSYRVFDTLPDPERFAPTLDVDLNPPCCIPVSIPGAQTMAWLLLTLLDWFYSVLQNWGFAIICLTILVRGAMSPLNFRMQKSMRAFGQKMAKLKPQMDALKKKHGSDQKAYQQAMLQFNRENKIMPPVGGCLPLLLTMPVYLGLFTALRTAYDLRHQPFLGWIDDLSSSDALFELGFWPGEFNLLPLLWIGLFVTMTLRQPLPTDPQQRQMQMMMRFMPILFGVMLYTYASALLLYMVTSMVWSLIESSITKKILGPMDPNSGMMAPTPM